MLAEVGHQLFRGGLAQREMGKIRFQRGNVRSIFEGSVQTDRERIRIRDAVAADAVYELKQGAVGIGRGGEQDAVQRDAAAVGRGGEKPALAVGDVAAGCCDGGEYPVDVVSLAHELVPVEYLQIIQRQYAHAAQQQRKRGEQSHSEGLYEFVFHV